MNTIQVIVTLILCVLHGHAVNGWDKLVNETNLENISNATHLKPIISLDYRRLPRLDNSYYTIHREPQTWNNARKICNYEGGYLVILNSETEAQYVTALLNALHPNLNVADDYDSSIAYIGFHGYFERGEYYTIDGQNLERSGFAHWGPGQPSGPGSENCGSIKRDDGLLNDCVCGRQVDFICEIPAHWRI